MRLLARTPVGKIFHSYADHPVTTLAWTEVVPSLGFPCSAVEIFSASGSTIKLSLGAVGEEALSEIKYYILPGGTSILLPLEIARGKRISAQAVDADATVGNLILNFFG